MVVEYEVDVILGLDIVALRDPASWMIDHVKRPTIHLAVVMIVVMATEVADVVAETMKEAGETTLMVMVDRAQVGLTVPVNITAETVVVEEDRIMEGRLPLVEIVVHHLQTPQQLLNLALHHHLHLLLHQI